MAAPPRPAPLLLERDAQLALVAAALEAAAAGHGAALAIEGAAGLGKTALVEAAARAAAERGLRVLRARGLELEVEHPFGVVRQLLDPVLRELGATETEDLLGGAAGLARAALTGDEPTAAGPSEFGALHGLYWLLAGLAARSPVALLVDDAHWLDGPSARLLASVAPRLEELPIALVIAARPGYESPLTGLPLTQVRPLTAAAVSRLVSERLARGDTALGSACAEASAGNPFYLTQLLVELERDPASATAERVRRLAPAGLARAVLIRLARLGPDAGAVARAVAVLGDGAPLSTLAELAGLDPPAARAAADALIEADLIAPATDLGFEHPLVRRAVYDDIAPFERAGAHRRAAWLLERAGGSDETIATQLLDAAPEAEGWAVAALRRAASRALRRGAPAIAAGLLERALREPPPRAERTELLLELAAAEVLAGRPEAGERFDGVLGGSEATADQRSRAAIGLGRLLAFRGRPEEAIELLERAQADAAGADADAERKQELLVELLTASQMHPRTRPLVAARLADLRVREVDAGTPAGRRLLARQALERSLAYQPVDEVLDSVRGALSGGRLLAEETAASPAYHQVLNTLSFLGRCDEAERMRSDAIDDARARGAVVGYALSSGFRGIDRLRAGSLPAAEADLRAGIELTREHWPPGVSLLVGFLIEVLVARGELEEARGLLGTLGPLAGERQAWDEVRFAARGRLRLAEGDAAGAASDLLESARIWHSFGIASCMLDADTVLALVRTGQRDVADRLTSAELAGARRCGAPGRLGIALRAAAVVCAADEREGLLREAIAALEDSPQALERAHALADLGGALRRTRKRAAARAPLERALELAAECDAMPLVYSVRVELEALGARPRSVVRRGVDALTPSERRVAEMAADGMQNREIAQALFVTVKTVETQLSSTYRKVGISSRRELGRALAAPRG